MSQEHDTKVNAKYLNKYAYYGDCNDGKDEKDEEEMEEVV